MQEVLDAAIEAERRRRFIDEGNAAYARLRQDDTAWSDMQSERAVWDATLMDGLAGDVRATPVRKRTRKPQ